MARPLIFIFCSLLTLGILVGSHYLLYFTTIRVFDIKRTGTKLTLRIAISALTGTPLYVPHHTAILPATRFGPS